MKEPIFVALGGRGDSYDRHGFACVTITIPEAKNFGAPSDGAVAAYDTVRFQDNGNPLVPAEVPTHLI